MTRAVGDEISFWQIRERIKCPSRRLFRPQLGPRLILLAVVLPASALTEVQTRVP